ncbi:MAG: cell division protein ZapA [Alphaproteobacteria bacterium]|nr:cell division protein ZapA [Alphaproteobacteria bacterium]
MRQISVTINDRDYAIACDEGQEEHLVALAGYLDKRVRELAASIGQVGHARLLVIAGLLVSDELSDAFAEVEQLKARVAALEAEAKAGAESDAERAVSDGAAAAALESAAGRIEAIAARLEGS